MICSSCCKMFDRLQNNPSTAFKKVDKTVGASRNVILRHDDGQETCMTYFFALLLLVKEEHIKKNIETMGEDELSLKLAELYM